MFYHKNIKTRTKPFPSFFFNSKIHKVKKFLTVITHFVKQFVLSNFKGWFYWKVDFIPEKLKLWSYTNDFVSIYLSLFMKKKYKCSCYIISHIIRKACTVESIPYFQKSLMNPEIESLSPVHCLFVDFMNTQIFVQWFTFGYEIHSSHYKKWLSMIHLLGSSFLCY